MPLDTILLPSGLFTAVALLARGASRLWSAKAVLLIGGGAMLVAVDPLAAGWIVGGAWAVLFLLPILLAWLAAPLLLAQHYRAVALLSAAVWLLHPEWAGWAQVELVRALAEARRGAFAAAIERLGRLAGDLRTPPGTALGALFRQRRLEGRLDLLLEEVDWQLHASPVAAMLRLSVLAELGRADDLIAVQAELGSLHAPVAGQRHVWAYALASLFVGTGRVTALERLLGGPLRRLPAEARAYLRALARFAAGGDGREALARLTQSPDRDLASRAARAAACPPAAVRLSAAQSAVVDAAETQMAGVLDAARGRPRLLRSPVTLALVATNLVAFAAEIGLGGSESVAVLRRLGALLPGLVVHDGEWWRVGAALFLHFGPVHLGVNMLALAGLGWVTERLYGSWRMLAIYLVAGIGSMAGIVLLVSRGWMAEEWVVGASGAIVGLFGALIADAARRWWGLRSAPALRRAGWLLGLVLVQAALDAATPEVSFAGHALGLAAGLLAAAGLGAGWAVPAVAAAAEPADAGVPRAGMSRRQAAVSVSAGAVAIGAALAFPGLRDRAAASAEARAARAAASVLTPAQLAGIRKLRFVFIDGVEAGGPAVDPSRPFGSPDPLADLAALAEVRDGAEVRRLYLAVMIGVPLFCARARLEPGTYPVDGETVTVTAEQLRLIPALSWEVPKFENGVAPEDGAWPVAMVDFKRPYGDMTYFEADMADVLGLPSGRDDQDGASLPGDLEARLDALHRTTAAALQAFVRHAAWPGGA